MVLRRIRMSKIVQKNEIELVVVGFNAIFNWPCGIILPCVIKVFLKLNLSLSQATNTVMFSITRIDHLI